MLKPCFTEYSRLFAIYASQQQGAKPVFRRRWIDRTPIRRRDAPA
jgi:hypothetical protein